ncbi:S-layer family protein, partial [Marinobacterium sp. xm-a-152]|uniref:beta strand repeat-containing protein n=1 Tax=Marinobacterium sp. xm-a-152 TaxID=2497733 RepID=UPI00156966E8
MNRFIVTSTLINGYYHFSVYYNGSLNSISGFETSLDIETDGSSISTSSLSISVNPEFDLVDVNESAGSISGISFSGLTYTPDQYGCLLYTFTLAANLIDDSTLITIQQSSGESFFDNNGQAIDVSDFETFINNSVDSSTYSTGDYELSESDTNFTSSETGSYTITGNDAANVLKASSLGSFLKGEDGDDTLIGGIGDDTFEGGTGTDLIVGGAGYDRVVIDGESYNYTLSTTGSQVLLSGTPDLFTGIEAFIFNDVERNLLQLSYADSNLLSNQVYKLAATGVSTGLQATALNSTTNQLTFSLVTDLSGETLDTSDRFSIDQNGEVYVGSAGLNYEAANRESVFILIEGSYGLRLVVEELISILNKDEAATGTLSVIGTAEEGATVSASFADLVDVDGTITSTTYQWQISDNGSTNWTNLGSETNASYAIASDQSQVGKYLRVVATTTDALGGETTFTSAASTAIANVNDAPVVATTQSITTAEDTAVSITVSGSDVDGDTLAYSVTTDPTHGSVTETSEGVFSYTPTGNYVGTDSFIVTVSDGNGGSDTQTINLTVTAVEDEATGTLSVTGSAEEGGTVSASFADLVDVDGTITSTTYQWQISDNGSTNWTNLGSETNASYAIASDQSQVGKYLRVVATTTDALGGETTFTSAASSAIANVNDAPVVATSQSVTTAEDTAVEITVSGSDVDGDTLAYS